MVKQKGKCVFDKEGNIVSGVIVRHLIIPGREEDSKKILNYLHKKYKNKIYISIMNQYTPVRKCKYDELNNTVKEDKYDEIIDYAWNIGIRKAFIQDGETQSDSFIPKWDFK
jgi:putative pyruvate formate lyase activating enzyme